MRFTFLSQKVVCFVQKSRMKPQKGIATLFSSITESTSDEEEAKNEVNVQQQQQLFSTQFLKKLFFEKIRPCRPIDKNFEYPESSGDLDVFVNLQNSFVEQFFRICNVTSFFKK